MNSPASVPEGGSSPVQADAQQDATEQTATTIPAADTSVESGDVADDVMPLVFKDHTGRNYIFPFEKCKNYTTFKRLLEQTYVGANEDLKNAVAEGKYDILTTDNEVVLPSVWDFVVAFHLQKEVWGERHCYTLTIKFWDGVLVNEEKVGDEEEVGRSDGREWRTRRRAVPGRESDDDEWVVSKDEDEILIVEPSRTVNFELTVDSGSQKEENSSASSDDDSTSTSSIEQDSRPTTPPPNPPPPRNVSPPVDRDGNALSFVVDTKSAPSCLEDAKEHSTEDLDKPRDFGDTKQESPLKILKATQTHSKTETRMTIKMHIFQGPENSLTAANINIRWYHVSGDHLDFSQFKSACLGVHGLSRRLRVLVNKTLEKVETEKLKAYLDGLFIEPGTVIRGDDSTESGDVGVESVIFSCIPYFDIRPPWKPAPGKNPSSDRQLPRTLMQTLYPYEPVRERDMEQAYRRLKPTSRNHSSNSIIHVPSLWMMNIGTQAIVTCAYHQMSSEFLNPYSLLQKNMINCGIQEMSSDSGRNIRLADWYGRSLLYTLEECRSYFQLEQKLRELRFGTQFASDDVSLELAYTAKDGGKKRLAPRLWTHLLNDRARTFIDVEPVVQLKIGTAVAGDEADEGVSDGSSDAQDSQVPPFFEWVYAGTSGVAEGETTDAEQNPAEKVNPISSEIRRTKNCLTQVEKALVSETVDWYETDVDQTFTTTEYYKTLPEETLVKIRSRLASLHQNASAHATGALGRTRHQIIVEYQISKLTTEVASLIDNVHQTLNLFVLEVNEDATLQKIWGAMMKLLDFVERVQNLGPCQPDLLEYSDPDWVSPITGSRAWKIRCPRKALEPFPANKEFGDEIKTCKRCRHGRVYSDPQAAFEHLRKHAQSYCGSEPSNRNPKFRRKEPKLEDWVRNHDQGLVEESNAVCLDISTQASKDTHDLYTQIRDLADGVKQEDGKLLELYTFPHELVNTFRKLVIYYLAIERAVHFTYDVTKPQGPTVKPSYSKIDTRISVLERFSQSVKTSIVAVRKDLCNMARTKGTHEVTQRMSLSAEYISAWLVRRLLAGSLDDGVTVADLYREYLSTLQFQVNHRPNKRLLRSLNLIQEEITALQQVNSWQTSLIYAYSRVLDDTTYQSDIPSRRAMYPYERQLLDSCMDNLEDAHEDYRELIRRCGPLSDRTKQSAEINEEDHGKAILVFTVVTTIFLPLSFVTSYLGMNTLDIRDMESSQSLFWKIAVPLTVGVMGIMLFIAYNGDELRSRMLKIYHRLSGKQETSYNARGISVAQRKRALKVPSNSSSSNTGYGSLSDETDFAPPATNLHDVGRSMQTTYINTDPTDYAFPEEKRYSAFEPYTTTRTYSTRQDAQSKSAPMDIHERERSYPRRPHTRAPPPPPPQPVYSTYSNNTAYDSTPPVYVKIERRFVDADSLAHFNLPWEYDSQDPRYIMIFKDMLPSETDALFAHSRNAREARRSGNRKRRGPRHAYSTGLKDEDDDEWYAARAQTRREYTWEKERPSVRVRNTYGEGSRKRWDF